MDLKEIITRAEETRKEFNPENVSPFPFEKMTEKNKDVHIYYGQLKEDVSGIILYEKEDSSFNIFINKNKPTTRQYFTLAHEFGHYFLHKEILVGKEGQEGEEILVDGESSLDNSGNILYRLDEQTRNQIEQEANNFAATLIMPEDLTREAWSSFHKIEECAKIFNVSIAAMSIRLTKLGLLN